MQAMMVIAVGLLFAAAAPQAELKKFQGTWRLVSAERDGWEMPKDMVERTTLIIKGDPFDFTEDAEVGTGPRGTFTVDPTKTPKAIDATPASGPEKGKT